MLYYNVNTILNFSLALFYIQNNILSSDNYKTSFYIRICCYNYFNYYIKVIYCYVIIVFAATGCGRSVSEKTAMQSSAICGQIRSLSRPPKVHSSRL